MARPKKNTVDYFPHDTVHQKTMFIIEESFGNDGYAFWFKLLEILGSTEDHYLDLNLTSNLRFLVAKTHIEEEICFKILDILADLRAIDPELWENKVIWSAKFISRIADVYTRRKSDLPQKPDPRDFGEQTPVSQDRQDIKQPIATPNPVTHCEAHQRPPSDEVSGSSKEKADPPPTTKTEPEVPSMQPRKLPSLPAKTDQTDLVPPAGNNALRLVDQRNRKPRSAELVEFFIACCQAQAKERFKLPPNKNRYRSWVDEADLLLKQGHDKQTIAQVVEFAASQLKDYYEGVPYSFRVDDPFKLRRRFDRLKAAMIRKSKTQSGTRTKAAEHNREFFERYRQRQAETEAGQ